MTFLKKLMISFSRSPEFIIKHPTFIFCFAVLLKGFTWIIIGLFKFIWLIIGIFRQYHKYHILLKYKISSFKGSVWIYSARYNISNNSADSNYCSLSFYNFAFGSITAIWVIGGIGFFLCCCICCCGILLACL